MQHREIPPLDLLLFLTESMRAPMHIGAVQVFEFPPDASEDYLLKLVEQVKQIPPIFPFDSHPVFPRFGMPRWEVADDIEMDYHVRHSALPRPGTTAQLMEMVQSLHSGLLDRSRPCWICHIIEGLEGNRFAMYFKVHHAYFDGMTGMNRVYGSLSSSPDENKVMTAWGYDPGGSSKTRHRRRKRSPVSLARKLTGQIKAAVQATELLSRAGLQILKLRDSDAQAPFMATRTRMNRPVKWGTRSMAVCSFDLDQTKAISRQRDCTINEVVLTVIGAALDDYLAEHHEKPRSPLVALCAVSVRDEGDTTATTRATAVWVRLGEPGAPIDERLAQVVKSSRASKDDIRGISSEALVDYSILIIGLFSMASRVGLDGVITPSYNVSVSNLLGPGDKGLYLKGSRMVGSYPFANLMEGVNLNISLLSHSNRLDIGLLGDRHALPDLGIVSQHMTHRFDDLERKVLHESRSVKRARKKPAAKRKSPRRRKAAGKSKVTRQEQR